VDAFAFVVTLERFMKNHTAPGWESLNRQIIACELCPRLRAYCVEIARERRAAYRDSVYWGKPVPDFGDPRARLVIVGLAPAAHGANRTGRMFTGDRSGEWLYRALYKAGFASQPESHTSDDLLVLHDCAITATCHCAPPDNKPLPTEQQHCRNWLASTIDLLPVRVVLALGQIAWRAALTQAIRRGWQTGRLPKFRHQVEVPLAGDRWLLGSYHPSQQNTFTGRLTEPMFDAVFADARRLLNAAAAMQAPKASQGQN
jgi:uracil-DNA glycosylase family 4